MAFQTQSPSKAVITSVGGAIGGGNANSMKPVITGTADAGTTINIYDGVRLLGTTTVAANGTWSYTPTADLKGGTHSFTVISVDSLDNWGTSSEPMSVAVGSSAPAAPIIAGLIDSVGPVQGVVANNGVTDDPRPALTGTGKAGDVIKLYDNGVLIGSGTVGADGKWSVKPTADLSKGSHDLYATETNSGGTSAQSAHTKFTFDATVPSKPIINGMTDDSGMPIPSGGATGDTHPTMGGTGTPGDTITMYDGPTPIGSTTVGPDGNWTVEPTNDLEPGDHDIYVVETSPAGVPSTPSDHTPIVIDTTAPKAPVITGLTDDHGLIPSGGTTADMHPTMSGTGKAGDTVFLYDGSKVIGSATVDADGQWSIKPTADLSDGSHDLYAIEKNEAGTPSAASAHTTFTVDTHPVTTTPVITSVIDAVGAVTGNVPSGGFTDDTMPTIKGTGKAGELIYIYDNGRGCGDTIVDADGNWSIQIKSNSPLTNAEHHITAYAKNTDGVWSLVSNDWAVTVDTSTPATPAAPVITDNDSLIPPGGIMPGGHPEISGTGASGDTIKVYDNGNVIGSTTIDGDGKWSFTPATDLSGGAHSITVIETNAAGTSSSPSAAINFTVGVTPVESVSITGLYDDISGVQMAVAAGGSTFDMSPIVKGTISSSLLAGEALVIYRDGVKLAGAATMVGNTWSYNDSAVKAGVHTYTARVENAAGEAGPTSAGYSFTEVSTLANGGYIAARVTGGTLEVSTTVPHGWGSGSIPYYSLKYYNSDGSLSEVLAGPRPSSSLSIVVPFKVGYYVATGYLVNNGVKGPEFPYVIVTSDQIASTASGQMAVIPPLTEIPDVLLPYFTFSPPSLVSAVHDTDNAHAQATSVVDVDSHAQVDHHTVVGTHEAFIGSTTIAHETVDLNVDPASYFKEATAHIEGAKGGAVDTLHLTGDHQILDLASLTGKTSAAKISGIEVIDLGGHENTLKLSLVDVLNLGEVDLFQQDGKQQLMVNGKEGDMVDLSNSHIAGLAEGEWEQHGTTQVGGVSYNVYEHSGAHTELLIQQGVQIAVH